MGAIVTVGSINMDFVYYVHNHPQPGETIHSVRTETVAGGKGANQAVAASLSGGRVAMIGAVGSDPYSVLAVEGLRQSGVDTAYIARKEGAVGTAFITVDDAGQNIIVLSGGANAALTAADLEPLSQLLQPSSVLLLQNEIPWACTRLAIETAHRCSVPVCFNPAPALEIPTDVFPLIDLLVLNETEAEYVTGVKLGADASEVRAAADVLIRRGVKEVIVTLGDKGSLYMNVRGETIRTPSFKVDVVDTTAAGDTFIGAFLAARQNGLPTVQCLRRASAASAIAVSRPGAQASIPCEAEVTAFLKK